MHPISRDKYLIAHATTDPGTRADKTNPNRTWLFNTYDVRRD